MYVPESVRVTTRRNLLLNKIKKSNIRRNGTKSFQFIILPPILILLETSQQNRSEEERRGSDFHV